MYAMLVSNMQHSCLCLLSTGITGMRHYAQFLLLVQMSSAFVLFRHMCEDQKPKNHYQLLPLMDNGFHPFFKC